MYRLLKGFGRLRTDISIVRELTEQDFDTPLNLLEKQYEEIYWIVDNPIMGDTRYVLRLQELPISYIVNLTSTIKHYLEDRQLNATSDETIPWSTEIPTYRRGEVYFWDADSRGFDYKAVRLDVHPDIPIPDEDKDDILLSREGTDHLKMGEYILVSINGLFHRHYSDKIGWLIKEGNKTRLKDINRMHIGVMDFTQIGKVECVDILPKMVRPANKASLLSDNIYIDISKGYNGSLENKTIGIVLGGYFHLLDHTYKRISDTVIKIDFNNLCWETLYYKMRDILDISHIGLTDLGNDRVIGFELYDDSTIMKLLTMSQSYIVIIDNPYLSVDEIPVGHVGIPRRYESAIKPIYPLRIGEGRYTPYKAIKEHDRWSIATTDNIVPLQVRYQRPRDMQHIIHNRRYPLEGQTYASAYYQIIHSDIVEKAGSLKHEEEDYVIPNLINEDVNNPYYQPKPSRYPVRE